MSRPADRTAAPDVPVPTADEVKQYRDMVASLMERCLDRIRRTPIPFTAEPLESWRVDD